MESASLRARESFPRLLIKVLYAIHGVVAPCPKLDPKLLAQMKTLWALHTGARPVDALRALDLDQMDFVLERPAVTRCRVCYKPCDGPVHRDCQKDELSCNLRLPTLAALFSDAEEEEDVGCGYRGELPPPPRVDCPEAKAQGLNRMLAILPRRCPSCGQFCLMSRCDRSENRPASSKVSKKRGRE